MTDTERLKAIRSRVEKAKEHRCCDSNVCSEQYCEMVLDNDIPFLLSALDRIRQQERENGVRDFGIAFMKVYSPKQSLVGRDVHKAVTDFLKGYGKSEKTKLGQELIAGFEDAVEGE